MFPAIGMILHLSTAAVLWFGGQRVDSGEMQVGALTAFLQYLLQILMAVMMGTFMAMMIPRASVCADRIGEVLDVEPSIHDPERPEAPAALAGVVEYRNVTFAYPGAEVPGAEQHQLHRTAGRDGRHHRLHRRGQDLPAVPAAAALRHRRGRGAAGRRPRQQAWTGPRSPGALPWCPQRPYLFSGTIEHNLRFGKTEATDQELWDALHGGPGRGLRPGQEERRSNPGSPRAAPTSPAASASGSASPGPW